MRRRVKPGHVEFGRMLTDRQVFVLCAARATELLVVALTLITTATGKRRGETNDESGDVRVRG